MQNRAINHPHKNHNSCFLAGISVALLTVLCCSSVHAEKQAEAQTKKQVETLAKKQTETKKKNKATYEDNDIYLRSVYRSPEQLAAFYEGREFPKTAIDRISQSCYVTIILQNKTSDILWLDVNNWVFKQNGKIIQRLDRAYWNKQWDEVKLKQAHRSTFGWTLMPDVRDLRPGEGVGGSVPIPMQSENFSLTLNFATGENKQGKVKSVTLPKIHCKQDTDEE